MLLPTLEPAHRALLLSQSGQQAAAWLTAVLADRATTLPPEVMQIVLRRRLRLRLPLGPATCGQEGHGCGRRLDAWGSCPRMPAHRLLGEAGQIGRAGVDRCVSRSRRARGARRPPAVANAHLRLGSAGIGPLAPRPRGVRRLPTGPRVLLRCHACEPVTSEGVPHRAVGGRKAQTRHERGGQRLCVLAIEGGGRWSRDAHDLVRQLVRAWARRRWGMLFVAVQHDRRDSAGRTVAAPQGDGRARTAPGSSFGAGGPSCLPMR